MEYFDGDHGNSIAYNKGSAVETLGILYCRAFPGGKAEPIKLFDVPVIINLNIYESGNETIRVHGRSIEVMTLKYMKDSYIFHQTLPKGREVGAIFLNMILNGKLPKAINYERLINIWYRNLEISGMNYKVPSSIYEMILTELYRNPNDMKERYGPYYASNAAADGYDYKTSNVRRIVQNLNTFAGIVFEDFSSMLSSGLVNSAEEVEEPVSPLEKIIHY